MPDTLEYIESYFQQTLNAEDRIAFETRCETDEIFAKEVAFYITARQALRETLLEQKTEQWKNEIVEEEETTPIISIARKSGFIRWAAYAAAACLLLVASVYFFEANTAPGKLAANYIQTNYATLGQTMDGSHDSVQAGIAAYNNKDYNRALQLFEGAEKIDSANSDAKKYAGLAYLQQQNYDKAIQQFDELAKMKLHNNAGDFLKAISLMERNNPGDREEAKQLLQKVITENEDGGDKAAEWLKKL